MGTIFWILAGKSTGKATHMEVVMTLHWKSQGDEDGFVVWFFRWFFGGVDRKSLPVSQIDFALVNDPLGSLPNGTVTVNVAIEVAFIRLRLDPIEIQQHPLLRYPEKNTPWKMNGWNPKSWKFGSDDFLFNGVMLSSMYFFSGRRQKRGTNQQLSYRITLL